MKERFDKIYAGFYVWDAPHRMIIIAKKKGKWECEFTRKSDDKKVSYIFNTLKECLSFVEFWFDDFNELINFS